MMPSDWEAQDAMLASAHAQLVADGLVEPVALGGTEERAWVDCDLASLAENHLGDSTPPEDLDRERRGRWLARLDTLEPHMRPSAREQFERCYWLHAGKERVGTLALTNATRGAPFAKVSSLYVLPRHRGRGIARAALDAIRRALLPLDLGLALHTYWTWQAAVGLYQSLGMWLRMWKRDLQFCWLPDVPPPIIDVGAAEATIAIDHAGERFVLERATRDGERLILAEDCPDPPDDVGEVRYLARTTLSLALARAGWPLVRSQAHWDDNHWYDAGPPEALAYNITVWEAWAHQQGFRVDTPRVAGLSYPNWAELEASWARPAVP